MLKRSNKMKELIHQGKKLISKNGFDIIECANCGFTHALPISSPEELERIYKNEYYDKDKPLYFQRMEEDRKWWEMTYHERYEKIEEKLGRKGRILDVGSGPGLFLEIGRERGWECVGLEPSRQAAEYSRTKGLDIREEFLTEESVRGLGLFDAVHMSEVLEHISDPIKFLNTTKKLIKKGGIISIIVPNDNNAFQLVAVEVNSIEPWWIIPPYHINYFYPKTLKNLVEKIGFCNCYVTTTFPIDIFLLMGDNYVGNDELGRSCHLKRKLFELNLLKVGASSLKYDFYKKLSELGLGREIIAFAEKI